MSNDITHTVCTGFVRSIVLGAGQPVANILQDTLRLITLWFSYGTKEGSSLFYLSHSNILRILFSYFSKIYFFLHFRLMV